MKNFILLTLSVLLVIGLASNAKALSVSGSDADVAAEGERGNAVLEWEITLLQDGNWLYEYTFHTNSRKDISHVIVQVSDTFTEANLVTPDFDNAPLTTGGYEFGNYNEIDQGNSNPGLNETIYGLKWNDNDPVTSLRDNNDREYWKWQIVTDRAPMWGSFYAVDGKNTTPAPYFYASNGTVQVPDTVTTPPQIPEPSTVLLLGIGLLGIVGLGRKFKK